MTGARAADWIRENETDAIARLKEWLTIPSVSTDPAYADDVRRAGQWAADHLRASGFDVQLHETGDPAGEGEDGELVYTGISGHGSVVCRYRTGDLAVGGVTWEPCPWCGRTLPRISSELRRVSDRHALNLTKIKGTLVDLSHIGTVISGHQDVEEWQVVLTKKDDDPYGLDEMTIRLTPKNGTAPAEIERRLRTEILDATEVSPNRFEFHPLEEMLDLLGMETEMKEKRYLDESPV